LAINNPYDSYRQNSVMYAKQGDLTMMLYNGAINFVKQGAEYIGQKQIEGASNALIRAQEIISYLTETLNWEYEVSNNLGALYFYINRQLAAANINKDREMLDEVLDLLEDLRQTWREALDRANSPGS